MSLSLDALEEILRAFICLINVSSVLQLKIYLIQKYTGQTFSEGLLKTSEKSVHVR